ncbi:serine/threonine-protein kinase [Thermoleptolyngbya sp. C42_A2020_037]|uniref:serine/threonine-protein kinase n=1 Tax=Thermoleptolyngbya sp. C42_A2020_037 TaxID=2747799 RepID=UPI0019FD7388|nr:serine/threonine-protein kinase [Thermoleptolyngbya sp. C42_A2020_037]MBF2085070.1 serine/threonine protein kinase [Thermoleptolyngbya sp. C42_A2020_037]
MHCLNPACPQPQDPGTGETCQHCGAALVLGDRFRAVKLLGQGGFGRTFLAIDERKRSAQHSASSRHCVIKQFFPLQRGDSRRAAELFRQEAERLRRLGQHPQIPRLLANLEDEDGQYLVQEYIPGKNLEVLLHEQKVFHEGQILDLLKSLLPVLAFIHSQRVIHRDVKPENIIQRQGDRELVLVDFGASKYVTQTALGKTGTMIGSAGYAAPEQVMGRAEFASDLYSLGVTCIHLLTGMHPFDLYSPMQDAWIWRQYLPEPIGDRLTRVLNKLLQRPISSRYKTAAAVLKDLGFPLPKLPKSNPAPRQSIVPAPRQPVTPLAPPPPLSNWHCTRTLSAHTGPITTLATSPDGLWIASGSTDKTIRLWSLETGDLLHTLGNGGLFGNGHGDRLSALAFTPDSIELLSASDDGTIKQWDIATQKLMRTIDGHDWLVSAIALSQHAPIFATGGGDGRINLWNLETGEQIASLGKHRDRISALLLSPDGHTLISASYDKTIRLWNLRTDGLIGTLRAHTDRITSLAITPDWQSLISAGADKTLRFWDLNRMAQTRPIVAHKDTITTLALSPQGTLLASGSDDNTIKLWALTRHPEIGLTVAHRPTALRGAWAIAALAFSPSGKSLVSGGADEVVRIWEEGIGSAGVRDRKNEERRTKNEKGSGQKNADDRAEPLDF